MPSKISARRVTALQRNKEAWYRDAITSFEYDRYRRLPEPRKLPPLERELPAAAAAAGAVAAGAQARARSLAGRHQEALLAFENACAPCRVPRVGIGK